MEHIIAGDAPLANYFGAAVFWLYIVAALVLTYITSSTILCRRKSSQPRKPERDDASRYFIALAFLSFTTLSSNMLGVLIQSFLQWSRQGWVVRDVANASLMQRIWLWSTTSTLFLDFGEAIVANQARYFWTSGALLVTMAVCAYMGVEGKLQNQ
jgi:hypothetical protein